MLISKVIYLIDYLLLNAANPKIWQLRVFLKSAKKTHSNHAGNDFT